MTPRDLLRSLVRGSLLALAVPRVLDIVEHDPMASAGNFPGDYLRGLMEVPATFWRHHPDLFDRYRGALRAGAIARRALPLEARRDFWGSLEG